MAELITKPDQTPSPTNAKGNGTTTPKPGRKSKFTTTEDLIIAQEVAAAEAHVSPHGETLTRFEKSAEKANLNPNFKHTVTGKNIQDRFKKILDDFAARDARDQNMSGTGGEVGELDQLLGDMLEAKKDKEATKDGDAKEKSDQEAKKLAAGKELVLLSLKRKERRSRSDDEDGDSPKKRRKLDLTDGMQELGAALKESESSRFALEKEKLELEKVKLDREAEERAAERAERAQEREQRKEELHAYRDTMEKMMKSSNQQMESVLGFVGTLLQQNKRDS